MSCLICGHSETDDCHIKTKGSGGSNEPWNIMPLCRTHHVEQHKIGIITFIKKYLEVRKDIESKGWDIINQFGRERLVREE